jgi:hypothetical protein
MLLRGERLLVEQRRVELLASALRMAKSEFYGPPKNTRVLSSNPIKMQPRTRFQRHELRYRITNFDEVWQRIGNGFAYKGKNRSEFMGSRQTLWAAPYR